MNTAAQMGSCGVGGVWVSSGSLGSYNVPFIPMVTLLLIGAWLWVKVILCCVETSLDAAGTSARATTSC